MGKIITYNFSQDFIACLAGYLKENLYSQEQGLSRVAVVFGGKRPALFLRKELSKRLGSSFFPPRFFSMDEFIKFIVSKKKTVRLSSDLEKSYLIYQVASLKAHDILNRRDDFADFLPWAQEIGSFIDELDLELVAKDKLKEIQLSAEIGYEIPERINKLLVNILKIIDEYHGNLAARGFLSRGLLYKEASESIGDIDLGEFDKILFCNFYYLHKSEELMIKKLFDRDKADLFFQKDELAWPAFDKLSKTFGRDIQPQEGPKPKAQISIYKGFDVHSQVGLVRNIIKNEILNVSQPLDKTLVMLPDADNLVPLLSEIAGDLKDFNVSMGYPLKRSSLFHLLQFIFKAQLRIKDGAYYTRDYLRILAHPLIKNLFLKKEASLSRIMVHKIEEMLLGMNKTNLSGSLFIKLKDVESSEELYKSAMDTFIGMGIDTDTGNLKAIVREIHSTSFSIWENISTFSQLAQALDSFCAVLLKESLVEVHPLDLKVLEKIYDIIDELKIAEFKDLTFKKEDLFRILESRLKDEKVSFKGSPLKGLQILGLLETRSITFDNVIIMDANEGLLPNVSVYEPLISRQIMEGLGLERLKQEEDIQRYHFMRLVMGARNVYFVYNDAPAKERSRFLEELVWLRQKEKQDIKIAPKSFSASYNVSVLTKEKAGIKKVPEVLDFLLKDCEYSASRVDTYLKCPLRFYFQYCLRLQEKEDLLDEPQAKDIGNFIHGFLDKAFRPFLNSCPDLNQEFEKFFFDEFDSCFVQDIQKRMGAEAFMVKEIMRQRLYKFLQFERQRKVKRIISLEAARPAASIRLGERQFSFKYRIDRIDLLDNESLLVLDYKTGSNVKAPDRLDKLESMEMSRDEIKKHVHSFQLPIYYYFTREDFKDKHLNAALYGFSGTNLEYFVRENQADTADKVMDLCLQALKVVLEEIIDPGTDFYPDTSDERACQYCPFSALCR
jgi:hypothetical protein